MNSLLIQTATFYLPLYGSSFFISIHIYFFVSVFLRLLNCLSCCFNIKTIRENNLKINWFMKILVLRILCDILKFCCWKVELYIEAILVFISAHSWTTIIIKGYRDKNDHLGYGGGGKMLLYIIASVDAQGFYQLVYSVFFLLVATTIG